MLMERRGKVLVADDDPDIREILHDRLDALGFSVITAQDGEEAVKKALNEMPDMVFLDLQMPRMDGLQALKKLRKEDPELSVIVVTAFGTIEKAVEAVRAGASDFIQKPFTIEHLKWVIEKEVERRALRQANLCLKGELNALDKDILGESPTIRKVTEEAKKASATTSTILLLGESGTGKEVFARAIHRWSSRSDRPFVVINCVVLRNELLESELFGHEKGAFTGAYQQRKGKLEIADGGTVFLDEIGDLNPELQAKLLRVLQEREFERVGGNRPIHVNIRVIAATHRDLRKEVQSGRFRDDLYFRLNVIALHLPPLRERKGDIPILVDYFLRRACQTVKKEGMTLTPAAIKQMETYHWPGNLREMGNLMERAVVLAQGRVITPDDLRLQAADPVAATGVPPSLPYHEALQMHQVALIQSALAKSGGNQTQAAELLGLQRTYLSRLLRKFNIGPVNK